jgi:hypothetical protein
MTVRDLIDCCTEAESYCGEGKPKAISIGGDVYVGNNLIARFDPKSDDYAYTNARKYAERWNKIENRE